MHRYSARAFQQNQEHGWSAMIWGMGSQMGQTIQTKITKNKQTIEYKLDLLKKLSLRFSEFCTYYHQC